MKAEIYYWKHSVAPQMLMGFRGVEFAKLDQTHDLIASVEFEHPGPLTHDLMRLCDCTFTLFNTDWTGDDSVKKLDGFADRSHTSLSVGDVVHLSDGFYINAWFACQSMGWQEITPMKEAK